MEAASARVRSRSSSLSSRRRRRVEALCCHLAAGCAGAGCVAAGPLDPPQVAAVFTDSRRATPCGPGGILTDAQVADYARDGFLLVSGLIPPAVAAKALDTMWRTMDRENRSTWQGRPLAERAQPLDRDDPSTWTSDWQGFLTHPDILNTFTPAYLHAAKQLVAAHAAGIPMANHQPSRPRLARRNPWAPVLDGGYRPDRPLADPDGDPARSGMPHPLHKYPFELRRQGSRTTRIGYPTAINNFPMGMGFKAAADRSPGRYERPKTEEDFSPHIDGVSATRGGTLVSPLLFGALPPGEVAAARTHTSLRSQGGREDGYRTCPQPIVLESSTVLEAAGVPGCGGTLCWPGLHRKLAKRYLEDPGGCEWVEGLVRDNAVAELAKRGGILPVETLPTRGDVLFHDFFCGHTGSPNHSTVPRLMFQCRFGVPSSLKATRHGGNAF